MPVVRSVDQFNLALTQARLMDELKEAQKQLHDFNKFLEDRYTEQAQEKLHEDGKDFGTASIFDGNQKVKVELRKKVEWDQEKLTNFLNKLTPEEANHLAKFSISVPEAKFTNALPTMQEKLKEFRTVSLQGVKVSFEEQE
tara:strand:- start:33 stop:455 length:423 start_codon:yes stop_codon:yes gene_type:complete